MALAWLSPPMLTGCLGGTAGCGQDGNQRRGRRLLNDKRVCDLMPKETQGKTSLDCTFMLHKRSTSLQSILTHTYSAFSLCSPSPVNTHQSPFKPKPQST